MKLNWKPNMSGEAVTFKKDGLCLRIEARNMPDFHGGASWSWSIRMDRYVVMSGFYLPTVHVAKREAEDSFGKMLEFWGWVRSQAGNGE